MDKLKKVGLTALGTALVSTSAIAADVAVGGGAKLTFVGGDKANTGNGWSMLDSLTFRASADLDNGWTVSTAQNLGKGSINNSNMKVNMGDMGTLSYQNSTGDLGIGKIDDLMPTAEEEVTNGIDTEAASNETLVGIVDSGTSGFNYTYTMDMATINVGYSPNSFGTNNDDGANSGAGGSKSSTSIAVTATPMDVLTVFLGTGDKGTATSEDEHEDVL
mgnify:CR=1 FL=1